MCINATFNPLMPGGCWDTEKFSPWMVEVLALWLISTKPLPTSSAAVCLVVSATIGDYQNFNQTSTIGDYQNFNQTSNIFILENAYIHIYYIIYIYKANKKATLLCHCPSICLSLHQACKMSDVWVRSQTRYSYPDLLQLLQDGVDPEILSPRLLEQHGNTEFHVASVKLKTSNQ